MKIESTNITIIFQEADGTIRELENVEGKGWIPKDNAYQQRMAEQDRQIQISNYLLNILVDLRYAPGEPGENENPTKIEMLQKWSEFLKQKFPEGGPK